MSNPYQQPYQKEEQQPSETVDDLMLRDDETEGDSEEQNPNRIVSERHRLAHS